ncbi:MAG: hypothetical protein JHC87_04860, partial [Thermoleophilaceae bacterium]|nr:hypothetical protein [Thermoleophilaceae bacterium]
AAMEGIVLGTPAIAVSQQAVRGQMGWSFGGDLDFAIAAAFAANVVAELDRLPLRPDTLLNINCPAGNVSGARFCRLGKRIYRDELQLEVEEGARKRYRIYGDSPSYHEEDGTDFEAIAEGEIAVTPIHFDLTDRTGLEALAAVDLGSLLAGIDTSRPAGSHA